jgi:hypothetical protein
VDCQKRTIVSLAANAEHRLLLGRPQAGQRPPAIGSRLAVRIRVARSARGNAKALEIEPPVRSSTIRFAAPGLLSHRIR